MPRVRIIKKHFTKPIKKRSVLGRLCHRRPALAFGFDLIGGFSLKNQLINLLVR